MYNRYIPEDTSYTRIERETPRPQNPSPGRRSQQPLYFPGFLSGRESRPPGNGEGGGLSSLLKTLRLDNIDTGDILLLLIMLYLLVEGDDLELVIALGLVLLMGLGEDREDKEE